uniref:Uncharacterized protein n=1 Tax=Aplanochytrium stocchinoi TaxID=215587 RepID=A0A6S8FFK2_9STRA|eukprot:CAMPEP_0204823260 /NCGR_PEP_ID=MMETSP1346-20131115/1333_1 /ASSEMBLY_ACC=CAM_ASM_000771 /TAXON_ID=215587 /ORGANISM="Aplanochytrium stocchinoi, Strain GSBS06" /LENGTH=222 /DNA_ID=CAMNT_0051949827 /DNA_START=158 /DNA_END=826 /DNA_ORIENTATION=-
MSFLENIAMIFGSLQVECKDFDDIVGTVLTNYNVEHNGKNVILSLLCKEKLLETCLTHITENCGNVDPVHYLAMMKKVSTLMQDITHSTEALEVHSTVDLLLNPLARGNEIKENANPNYNSKVKPEMVMTDRLFELLSKKHHGDKTLMTKDASLFIRLLKKHAKNDVKLQIFEKILKNDLDDSFWRVCLELESSIVTLKRQYQDNDNKIIKHMYHDDPKVRI